ncbi:MAG: extracellular solute-binding protein [Pseudomonadota bacterium]
MRIINTVATVAMMLSLLLPWPLQAFEKESERLFQATATQRHVLKILSTTDLDYFEPLIAAYQQQYPTITVLYTVASSVELYRAINDEAMDYDVVISSAMDLQMKLVNDGFAQQHRSAVVEALPVWSRWGNSLFAFTQEPAVLLASRKGLGELPVPNNRNELIALLRDNPERFNERIGTYDIRTSGAGYLFATQDSRQSDAFWRLAEVIGSTSPRLYCCSSDMIEALRSGEIVFAYNVVGSYASAVLDNSEDGMVVPLTDYQIFMLRTALIPKTSGNAPQAGTFIDFLADANNRELIGEKVGLPPVDGQALQKHQHFRPISLGPGLLVYLDRIKRKQFIKAWSDAVLQP